MLVLFDATWKHGISYFMYQFYVGCNPVLNYADFALGERKREKTG